MALRTLVIVNPASGGGSTRRRFPHVLPRVKEVLGDCDVVWTGAPHDAERLAREGVRAGVERVVVGGGDGTLSEVATGILAADLGHYCEIGLLPLGTGGDLRRTLGVPGAIDDALQAIAHGRARAIDAGRASYRGRDGKDAVTYFVNVASAGISGQTTELVNRAPKWLGGSVSFLVGTVRSILSYRAKAHPVELSVDGRVVYSGPLVLATAANGRYFGGGMQVAPDARPDDALLDMVLIPDLPPLRLLRELRGLYRGTHVNVPGVLNLQGRVIEARPLSADPAWIELDGEPLGTLPARFEVLPGALRLLGPPPR